MLLSCKLYRCVWVIPGLKLLCMQSSSFGDGLPACSVDSDLLILDLIGTGDRKAVPLISCPGMLRSRPFLTLIRLPRLVGSSGLTFFPLMGENTLVDAQLSLRASFSVLIPRLLPSSYLCRNPLTAFNTFCWFNGDWMTYSLAGIFSKVADILLLFGLLLFTCIRANLVIESDSRSIGFFIDYLITSLFLPFPSSLENKQFRC